MKPRKTECKKPRWQGIKRLSEKGALIIIIEHKLPEKNVDALTLCLWPQTVPVFPKNAKKNWVHIFLFNIPFNLHHCYTKKWTSQEYDVIKVCVYCVHWKNLLKYATCQSERQCAVPKTMMMMEIKLKNIIVNE